MNRSELKDIILDQNLPRNGQRIILRNNEQVLIDYLKNKFIIVVSGVRRCGKSTLIRKINSLYPGYYLNFDDERLINFKLEDFELLHETFIELYGEKEIFYFDEIQNITGWERYVRRLHDRRKKVIVTGSNATMLSRELGTHLTGRYLEIKMYPFSFKEYLRFNNLDKIHSSATKAFIKKSFDAYLLEGGFPEYLIEKNKEYLKLLYENILYRDIIVRYNLSGERNLKDLIYLIVTNLSNEITFNSLTKYLSISSPTTIKEYFDYLENSYLSFLVPRFDFSARKQIQSPKKAYIIDNALAVYLGFRFSNDYGKLLENLVFLELKRRGKDIYYFSGEHECDFIIKEGIHVTEAIQVCYELNRDNREREISGILESMKKLKIKNGKIITIDQNEELKIGRKKILIVPAWKWLLEN